MALEIDGKRITEFAIGGTIILKDGTSDFFELEVVFGEGFTEKFVKIFVLNPYKISIRDMAPHIANVGFPINQQLSYIENINHFSQNHLNGNTLSINIRKPDGTEITHDKIIVLENDGCIEFANDYWRLKKAGKAKIQINA